MEILNLEVIQFNDEPSFVCHLGTIVDMNKKDITKCKLGDIEEPTIVYKGDYYIIESEQDLNELYKIYLLDYFKDLIENDFDKAESIFIELNELAKS